MQRTILLILFTSAVSGLCSLGFWQLDRADEKRELHKKFESQYNNTPLASKDVFQEQDLDWRKATLTGTYEKIGILLDNRVVWKKTGYEVLTPFRLSNDHTVLVNRGWVFNQRSREHVPDLPVPTQVVEIVGYFGPPPVVGINFSDDRSSGLERLSPEIFRAQRVDFSTLRSEIEISSLMSTVFYLDEAEIGALKVARKQPGSGAEKHEAYATQWFSMAFVLAFIGLWNSFRKKDHDD